MVKALTRCIGCTHQPNIALLDGRLDLLPRGRDPAEIPIFAMMTIILAATDPEAKAKLADYRRYIDPEGALPLMSGWTAWTSHASIPTKLSSM